MKKGKIGVQMMMLKPQVAEHGMYEVLKKLHEMGFHYVEVSQLVMDEDAVSQMKRACDEFGMEISSLSCSLRRLRVPSASCQWIRWRMILTRSFPTARS